MTAALLIAGLGSVLVIRALLNAMARRGGGGQGDAGSAGQVLDQLDAMYDDDREGRWDGVDRLETPPPGYFQW